MKIQLSPLVSDIIICIYVVVSLFIRLKVEFETYTSPINSLAIGIFFLVILAVTKPVTKLNTTCEANFHTFFFALRNPLRK